ncbi:ssDNA binding protein [Arthrobacter phage Waltz]|nr:ssDNA binding protein [Arthrobacter phage Waltz]
MAGDTQITVIGNLTNDPELRFTPSGSAVANFTIASTPRTFDRQANEWKDGETLFLRSAVWREAAENVAETLTKGMRVVAHGILKSRSYETKEGEKRTVIELEIDEIGPSLRYAKAKVERVQSGNGQGGGFGGGQQGQGGFGGQQPQQNAGGWGGQPQGQPQGGGWGGQPQTQQADDPWATPGQPPVQQPQQYAQQPQQNPTANGWGTQPPQQGQNPNAGWGNQPQQGQPQNANGEPPF